MPRRPEIGNIQLYPNRPLKRSDRNGYVLKFYCPIKGKRIRRNCGTRDRREARRILRECRKRLLNGEYTASGGAITATHLIARETSAVSTGDVSQSAPKTWQDCRERYRQNRATRVRSTSLVNALSRIDIAERIFAGYREDRSLSPELVVSECMTLDCMESFGSVGRLPKNVTSDNDSGLRQTQNDVVPTMVPSDLGTKLDGELARVVAAWPALPTSLQQGILAMIQMGGSADSVSR